MRSNLDSGKHQLTSGVSFGDQIRGLTRLFFMALLATVITEVAQLSKHQAVAERRTTPLICTLSAFFSGDAGNFVPSQMKLEGRGILSCKNDGGFSTELPVEGSIDVDARQAPKEGTEVTISGNSAPFVLTREVNQIQDTYAAREQTSGSSQKDPSYLLSGNKTDTLIDLKISSKTSPIAMLRVKSMHLKTDESAPTLKDF